MLTTVIATRNVETGRNSPVSIIFWRLGVFIPHSIHFSTTGKSAKNPVKLRILKSLGEYLTRGDDLGRVVIPKEIRRTMRIREGDPLLTTLTLFDRFCIAIHSVVNRHKEKAE